MRAANVYRIEEGKKMFQGRVQEREILEKEGKEMDGFLVERIAETTGRKFKSGREKRQEQNI